MARTMVAPVVRQSSMRVRMYSRSHSPPNTALHELSAKAGGAHATRHPVTMATIPLDLTFAPPMVLFDIDFACQPTAVDEVHGDSDSAAIDPGLGVHGVADGLVNEDQDLDFGVGR